jgi:hypothetical protein
VNFSLSTSMKRSNERTLSAGLIHMNPMHSGYEDFLMQKDDFQGHTNCELIQKGTRNAEGKSTTASTRTQSGAIACKFKAEDNWRESESIYPNF